MSTSPIGSIKVYNLAQPTVIWEQPVQNLKEYRDLKNKCFSGSSVEYPYLLLFPARTNFLSNFAEDFFFPSLYHGWVKVDSLAQTIIENLVFFLIDLVTLPVRIVTCIPRAFYNALQKEHLFLTYLKQQNVPKQLLETDHVRVEFIAQFEASAPLKETSVISGKEEAFIFQSGGVTVCFVATPLRQPGGTWSAVSL